MFAAKKDGKKRERASSSSSSSSSDSESSSESSSDSEESEKESKKKKKKAKKLKKKQKKKDKKMYLISFDCLQCKWCLVSFILTCDAFLGPRLKVLKRKNKKSWLHLLYVLKKFHPSQRIDSS